MNIKLNCKFKPARTSILLGICLLGMAPYTVAPVSGIDTAMRASMLYKSGRMESAREAYIDLVCQDPNNYYWRYCLANAYFKLHDYHAAQIQYEFCMELYPDAQTASFCKAGLKNVKRCLGQPVEEISEEFGGSNFVSSLDCMREQRREAAQIAINNQRDKLITDAHVKAREIRANANSRLEAIRNNATWWYNDPLKNALVPVVSPALEQAIKDNAESRAEEIVSAAQKNASELQAPESDDVIEGLLSQTQPGGKHSSVRLLPFGSNMYVRNYGHRNTFAVSGLSGKRAQ